jgi:hypothetical protein
MRAEETRTKLCSEGTPGTSLSPCLLAQRVAEHLEQIGQEILAVERSILMSAGPRSAEERAKLQSLDQIVQKLAGLARILADSAPLLPEGPDALLTAIVARPRLRSLEDALLGTQTAVPDRKIDLF